MLELTTLGGLSAAVDGVPLVGAAAQRSRLALLTLLSRAGPKGISRDKVLACFWPERDERHARSALKQRIYALRTDFGQDAILGTSTLSVDPGFVRSDLLAFDSAIGRRDYAAAVAVYSGPFLDGVYLKGSAEFERWADQERVRLSLAWSDAVERLAAECERRRERRDAVVWWRVLATSEPLNGRLACSLARALAESGDVAAALGHVKEHAAALRAELGISPGSEIVALAAALRDGSWRPAGHAGRAAGTEVLGEREGWKIDEATIGAAAGYAAVA